MDFCDAARSGCTTKRYGVFFEAMRGAPAWRWRWASVAALTATAAITGASGVPGGACTASLAVCSVILLASAALFAVARPHALPSDNILAPVKFLLLGLTCIALISLHETHALLDALVILAALQTCVTCLRVVILLFLFANNNMARSKRATGEALSSPQVEDEVRMTARALHTVVDVSSVPSPAQATDVVGNNKTTNKQEGDVDPDDLGDPLLPAEGDCDGREEVAHHVSGEVLPSSAAAEEEEDKEGDASSLVDHESIAFHMLHGTGLAVDDDGEYDDEVGPSLLLQSLGAPRHSSRPLSRLLR